MKRPHRRIHVMIWLILGPLTTVTAILFWTMRPATPYTELPPSIEDTANAPEGQ